MCKLRSESEIVFCPWRHARTPLSDNVNQTQVSEGSHSILILDKKSHSDDILVIHNARCPFVIDICLAVILTTIIYMYELYVTHLTPTSPTPSPYVGNYWVLKLFIITEPHTSLCVMNTLICCVNPLAFNSTPLTVEPVMNYLHACKHACFPKTCSHTDTRMEILHAKLN